MKNSIMLRTIYTLILIVIVASTTAQTVTDRPKLVIGIVVDQMRWDYLYRYSDKYTSEGFKRLLNKGYSCEQTFINYFPSYTAPGHTAIYTGSVPAIHGITANDWFDRSEGKMVYCTEDTTVQSVGGSQKAGQQSPRRMYTSTICDELRLATNLQSKTIGVALKDRGSILPAGHTANAAYWYDGATGNWISSTYYMKELPMWVQQFNTQKLPTNYVKKNWNTLLEISKYYESTEDDKWYENTFSNEDKPVFEHKISEIKKQPLTEVLKATPFGNTLTLAFAKAAIIGDTLGNRGTTDFLTLSFSSTDYIGHQFGPNSVEAEDAYIRLDKELSEFIDFLNEKIGDGNFTIFLSADHGAAHAAGFSHENHLPAGNIFDKKLRHFTDSILQKNYQRKNLVSAVTNQQIILNHQALQAEKIDLDAACKLLVTELSKIEGVDRVISYNNLQQETMHSWFKECLSNQYKPNRTGDIQLLFHPAWLNDFEKGTTHGTIFPYDTHIPLLFYGWGVKHGKDYSRTYITDIAPTIAALLKIQMPNGTVGKPVTGILK